MYEITSLTLGTASSTYKLVTLLRFVLAGLSWFQLVCPMRINAFVSKFTDVFIHPHFAEITFVVLLFTQNLAFLLFLLFLLLFVLCVCIWICIYIKYMPFIDFETKPLVEFLISTILFTALTTTVIKGCS